MTARRELIRQQKSAVTNIKNEPQHFHNKKRAMARTQSPQRGNYNMRCFSTHQTGAVTPTNSAPASCTLYGIGSDDNECRTIETPVCKMRGCLWHHHPQSTPTARPQHTVVCRVEKEFLHVCTWCSNKRHGLYAIEFQIPTKTAPRYNCDAKTCAPGYEDACCRPEAPTLRKPRDYYIEEIHKHFQINRIDSSSEKVVDHEQ